MLSQLVRRVALRAVHTARPLRAGFGPLTVATRVQSPTRSFVTSTLSLQPVKATVATAKPASKATSTTSASRKAKRRTAKKPGKAKVATKRTKLTKKAAPKEATIPMPPKANLNAYMVYSVEYRNQHPKPASLAENGAIMRTLSENWYAMSEAERQPYLDKSAELRKEYLKRAQEYYEGVDGETLKKLRMQAKRKGVMLRIPAEIREQLAKRPTPPYIRFFKESSKQIEVPANLDNRQRVVHVATEVSKRWRSLPKEEKETYSKAYEYEFAEWKKQPQHSALVS